MFEEGQLYSPVTRSACGAVTVHFGADRPSRCWPREPSWRSASSAASRRAPEDRVPHLFEVTERLAPLAGWAYHPAPA